MKQYRDTVNIVQRIAERGLTPAEMRSKIVKFKKVLAERLMRKIYQNGALDFELNNLREEGLSIKAEAKISTILMSGEDHDALISMVGRSDEEMIAMTKGELADIIRQAYNVLKI